MCSNITRDTMSTTVARFTHESSKIAYISLLDMYLQEINPPFFEKCGNGAKQIVRKSIKKNTIPENDHIFVGGNDKVSTKGNSRAIPYVTEAYANKWIYDINRITNHREELKKAKKEKIVTNIAQTRIERKQFDPTNLKPLPNIVEVEYDELFKDEEGNVLQIEMRGEKTQDGLFFKALDLDKLNISSKPTYDTFTRKDSDYVYDEHYVFFEEALSYNSTPNWCTVVTKSAEVTPKKVLYLTYFGLVKYFICSRSPKANPFQKWAISTLFTHQFGNISRSSVNQISCVYLYTIGCVGDIRKYCLNNNDDMALDGYADDDILYKFGYTKDLDSREKDHHKTYGIMTNSDACGVEMYTSVDKALVSKAETTLKNFFEISGMKVDDKKRVELVVIPKSKMKHVRDEFSKIHTMYMGSSADYIHKIELREQEHKNELQEKDIQLHKKDIQLHKKDIELLFHENKYLKMMMEMQNP